jgi:hypothetical protein
MVHHRGGTGMKTIIVTLRDNNDDDFKYVQSVQISKYDYDMLKDYDMDGYDAAWDRLCAIFERMSGLPADWYIDHIEF